MQGERDNRDRDELARLWRNAQHRRNEDLRAWLRHFFRKPKQSVSMEFGDRLSVPHLCFTVPQNKLAWRVDRKRNT